MKIHHLYRGASSCRIHLIFNRVARPPVSSSPRKEFHCTSAGGNTPGELNKGLLDMQAGIAIAAFLDDTTKINQVVDLYRTYPGAGPFNMLPTGETGETGRDEGHVQAGMLGAAFISEVASTATWLRLTFLR